MPISLLMDWAGRLSEADRILAYTEIETAINAGSSRLLSMAQEKAAQGDQAAVNEQYLDSIQLYAKAYQLAAKAIALPH